MILHQMTSRSMRSLGAKVSRLTATPNSPGPWGTVLPGITPVNCG